MKLSFHASHGQTNSQFLAAYSVRNTKAIMNVDVSGGWNLRDLWTKICSYIYIYFEKPNGASINKICKECHLVGQSCLLYCIKCLLRIFDEFPAEPDEEGKNTKHTRTR